MSFRHHVFNELTVKAVSGAFFHYGTGFNCDMGNAPKMTFANHVSFTSLLNAGYGPESLQVDGDLVFAGSWGYYFKIFRLNDDGTLTLLSSTEPQYANTVVLDTVNQICYVTRPDVAAIYRIDYSNPAAISYLGTTTKAGGLPWDRVGYSSWNSGFVRAGDWLYAVPYPDTYTTVQRVSISAWPTYESLTILNRGSNVFYYGGTIKYFEDHDIVLIQPIINTVWGYVGPIFILNASTASPEAIYANAPAAYSYGASLWPDKDNKYLWTGVTSVYGDFIQYDFTAVLQAKTTATPTEIGGTSIKWNQALDFCRKGYPNFSVAQSNFHWHEVEKSDFVWSTSLGSYNGLGCWFDEENMYPVGMSRNIDVDQFGFPRLEPFFQDTAVGTYKAFTTLGNRFKRALSTGGVPYWIFLRYVNATPGAGVYVHADNIGGGYFHTSGSITFSGNLDLASRYEDFREYTAVRSPLGSFYLIDEHCYRWVHGNRNKLNLLYKDFGEGYFSGNFKHQFKAIFQNETQWYHIAPFWSMSNLVEDFYQQTANVHDGLTLFSYYDGAWRFYLREDVSGIAYQQTGLVMPAQSDNYPPVYLIEVERDESVGTYGTMYVRVYGGLFLDTLVGSMSLALRKKCDFRYLYAIRSFCDSSNTAWFTTSVRDLDLDPDRACDIIHRCVLTGLKEQVFTQTGTSISIEVSNDGGTTWENYTPLTEHEHVFSSQGSDFRCRYSFSGTNIKTPHISGPNKPGVLLFSGVYPDEANVRQLTQFGNNANEFTGTAAIPAPGDVRQGAAVDATVGTLALPAATDVRDGIAYGAAGTEYEGLMMLPSPAVNVAVAVAEDIDVAVSLANQINVAVQVQ